MERKSENELETETRTDRFLSNNIVRFAIAVPTIPLNLLAVYLSIKAPLAAARFLSDTAYLITTYSRGGP